jgi:hypothetical protein
VLHPMYFVYPTISVVVVHIDVFGALTVDVNSNKLKRGLVAAAEPDGMEVVARVADQLEEADKSRSLFGGVHESEVLSFSCRGCGKPTTPQTLATTGIHALPSSSLEDRQALIGFPRFYGGTGC